MRAVRFDRYGDVDELYVADVPVPVAGPGQVVVQVRAAGLNPGERGIREGVFAERWPATFPSGQGSDVAGVVHEVGPDVTGFAVGDEVVGWADRSTHAEYVVTTADRLVPKPAEVPWEVAGGLHVAGGAAWAGLVSVDPQPGETIVVSGASGGVGVLDVQLVHERGARVIALASARHRDLLTGFGAELVEYDPRETLADRLRSATGGRVDGWIDTFGGGYVDVAVELGVPVDRINTVADFAAAARLGVPSLGTTEVTDAGVLTALLERLADGRLVLPVASTYPLDRIRDAVREVDARRTVGKVVVVP